MGSTWFSEDAPAFRPPGGPRFESYGIRVRLGGTTAGAFCTVAAAVLLLVLVRRVTGLQAAWLGH